MTIEDIICECSQLRKKQERWVLNDFTWFVGQHDWGEMDHSAPGSIGKYAEEFLKYIKDKR